MTDASHLKPSKPSSSKTEQIVVLTDAAAKHLQSLLAEKAKKQQAQNIGGMRLSLKKGGCAGMSYEMDFARESQERDIRQEEKGVVLYIDPLATMFLIGTVIDHKKTKLASGFTFSSPKATAKCGCGESVNF